MHINEGRRLNSRQIRLLDDFERMLRNSFVDPDSYGPVDPDPRKGKLAHKKEKKKMKKLMNVRAGYRKHSNF
jgi:hypothetical protein